MSTLLTWWLTKTLEKIDYINVTCRIVRGWCAAQLKACSFDCSMSMAVETPNGLTSLPRALDVVLFVYGNRFYVTLYPRSLLPDFTCGQLYIGLHRVTWNPDIFKCMIHHDFYLCAVVRDSAVFNYSLKFICKCFQFTEETWFNWKWHMILAAVDVKYKQNIYTYIHIPLYLFLSCDVALF